MALRKCKMDNLRSDGIYRDGVCSDKFQAPDGYEPVVKHSQAVDGYPGTFIVDVNNAILQLHTIWFWEGVVRRDCSRSSVMQLILVLTWLIGPCANNVISWWFSVSFRSREYETYKHASDG